MIVDNGDGTFSIKSPISFEKQEPVAWMDKQELKDYFASTTVTRRKRFANDIPLYTEPQYRELSDEEIEDCVGYVAREKDFYPEQIPTDRFCIEFARAILRKAQEK